MGKIVAIGGGSPGMPGQLARTGFFMYDQEIIKLTHKKNPKLLFIPTASKDSVKYSQAIVDYFGRKLKCRVDVLNVVKEKYLENVLKKKILNSDIVYVGGGNTLYMISKWKKLGIDRLLYKAYKKGVVMSGLSAGAICWFKHGTSDSRMMTNPKYKKYIRVSGLGWISFTLSPHHISEKKRKKGLIQIINKYGGVGLALDDYAAIEIIDKKFRIITAKIGVGASKVYKVNGKVTFEKIVNNKFYSLDNFLVHK
jgi:dipeptidase E